MEPGANAPPRLGTTPVGDQSEGGFNSIFERPLWLDAVAPGAWDAVTVRRDGRVVARLPYATTRVRGLRAIMQPPLTQALGPWLAPIEGKYTHRMSHAIDLLGELADGLPSVDLLSHHLAPSLPTPLPFVWRGYSATPRVTYRLEDLSDLDAIWNGFSRNTRRLVRVAERSLEVRDDLGFETLLELNRATYRRQGIRPPHDDDLMWRIEEALGPAGQRRLLVAVDSSGRPHAADYVVWDDACLYCVFAARSDEARTSGASNLTVWKAIEVARGTSRAFDFTGSMLPGVERFLRAFGGRQVSYLAISKTSRRARPLVAARELLRRGGGG